VLGYAATRRKAWQAKASDAGFAALAAAPHL